MTQQILLAVGILTALGLLAGLILAIASAVMAVPRNEKAERLRDALPGANCGACGYSGCEAYAEAMAGGNAKVGLCTPGGAAVADRTSEILGLDGSDYQVMTAFVRCGGREDFTTRKLEYIGINSCAAANQFYGGNWACGYGCLGYGDCAAVCEYGAITIEDGLARVDASLCRGCTKCVSACPKSLIVMAPGNARGVVRCSSHDKGGIVRKACKVGCIGCMKCVKVCEHDAIHVENYLAKIDFDKCIGCGACADNCPVGCITIFGHETKQKTLEKAKI